MLLEDTEYWAMTHDADTRSIALDWKPTTAEMSADDFKQALEHLAEHIREKTATGALIDVRSFRFAMTPELDGWRIENIVPAYNAGGLRRFSYLLPPGAEYRPGGGGDSAAFVTDYFHDRQRARAWLRDA